MLRQQKAPTKRKDHKKYFNFDLVSKYKPAGDQDKAIKELSNGLKKGLSRQTLLGVTGSGKTFTIANIIQSTQRPAIILAHNKTLAAQLYGEMKEYFPHNAVEYFVCPSLIALIAASFIWRGVSKSGSPAPRLIMSFPSSFNFAARLRTALVADGNTLFILSET